MAGSWLPDDLRRKIEEENNQNKNQKYIFDLAEKLKYYKIQFHFIGNSCFLNECGIEQGKLLLNNC